MDLLLVMINITGMSMSISFWKRQRVLISVRARRISMHLQDLQSLFRRTKKFRWLLMNMGKDVLYISADFRTALRTPCSSSCDHVSTHSEDELKKWFSTNYNVDVHAYPKNNKYCVVNNTDDPQSTTIYRGDGSSFDLEMEPNGIIWYEIQ